MLATAWEGDGGQVVFSAKVILGTARGVYTEAGGGWVRRATREGPSGLGDSRRKARAFIRAAGRAVGSEGPRRGLWGRWEVT